MSLSVLFSCLFLRNSISESELLSYAFRSFTTPSSSGFSASSFLRSSSSLTFSSLRASALSFCAGSLAAAANLLASELAFVSSVRLSVIWLMRLVLASSLALITSRFFSKSSFCFFVSGSCSSSAWIFAKVLFCAFSNSSICCSCSCLVRACLVMPFFISRSSFASLRSCCS